MECCAKEFTCPYGQVSAQACGFFACPYGQAEVECPYPLSP